MLSLIGIGLADEKDITVKGLEAVRAADKIYLEGYTSLLQVTKEDLEAFYQKKIILANRLQVENKSQELLDQAKTQHIALLVIGDPLCATTHTGLLLEAKQQGIPVQVIHNASVLTAIGETGLQLYKVGRVSSIPYHETDVPYTILEQNKNAGLHTLFLLDLNPDKKQAMSAAQAAKRLLALEDKHQQKLISPLSIAIVCERLATNSQKITAAPLSSLAAKEFGPAPHCLIIPGELHFLEEEWLKALQ